MAMYPERVPNVNFYVNLFVQMSNQISKLTPDVLMFK